MSIRTDPMKAVPVLLKHVKTARTKFHQSGGNESLDGKLEKLTRELNKIEDVFMRVKQNQDELIDTLHEVDGHLRKLDSKRLDQDMDAICTRIRDCAHKLLPKDTFEEDQNIELVQSPPSSSQHKKELLLYKHVQDVDWDMLQSLDYTLRYCLRTLSMFPEDAIINKWLTIYCWIGDGVLESTSVMTAEEVGEYVIARLLQSNIIVPYGNVNCPLVNINKFILNPHARPRLMQRLYMPRKEQLHHLGCYLQMHDVIDRSWLVLTQQKVTVGEGDRLKLDSDVRTVFNVGVRYLNVGSQWLDKSKNLKVLQLGRWQDSPSHHIEVGSQFLQDLRNQKELRFLSLRGISRISELPPSIAQLENLQILDLKACHNLETLPDDISSMKSLTHLILSQCYLLDGMPKGIEKLTKLEVLKGFLIGSSRKTPCRISDLAKLKKLRRLSIRIGSRAVIKDGEFESLGELLAVEHLKISWGVSRYSDIQITFPPSLKKLHLECFPGKRIPEWLPNTYSKWLKITGGQLESMNRDEDRRIWGTEIVCLKYLKHLQVDLIKLKKMFPVLRYVEIKESRIASYFEWRIRE